MESKKLYSKIKAGFMYGLIIGIALTACGVLTFLFLKNSPEPPAKPTSNTILINGVFYNANINIIGDKKFFFGGKLDISKKNGVVVDKFGQSRIEILEYCPNKSLTFAKIYLDQDTLIVRKHRFLVTWRLTGFNPRDDHDPVSFGSAQPLVTYYLKRNPDGIWSGYWIAADADGIVKDSAKAVLYEGVKL